MIVVLCLQLVAIVDFNAHVIAHFCESLIGDAFPFQLDAMGAVTLGGAIDPLAGFYIPVNEDKVGMVVSGVEPLKAKKEWSATHSKPVPETP
ncbi:hypothetical protein CFBP5875_04760 [Agrobacterium pusense]|uniref:hypothetical protein n=1 Tax=Agrobacterium pusense TaxID=648995 RepID=UPI0010BF0F96|nr:hypothetical protein [Agrobacterium pusense]QCL83929.1 hypothetical protein CFBP5875_04760 [Agrobacterium pusense]